MTRTGRLIALACLAGWTLANVAFAQSATAPALNPKPEFRPMPASPLVVPAALVGVWQVQIEGRAFKLRTNYNIEIKITDGRDSLPSAIVSYFAGDAKRPSTICRSQLTLVSTEGQNLIFDESRNYQGGRDPCPIWHQMAFEPRAGHLWLRWRDGWRKPAIRMEAGAYRWTGGRECRLVDGNGGSGGQEWCRDAEGNWSSRRS